MISAISTPTALLAALDAARARVEAMSDAERSEMFSRQRESWVRAFQPCEHGVYDFEQCGDCRGAA